MNDRGAEGGLRYGRKIKVLTHYGNGKCACVRCGFDNVWALSIDHIEGRGEQDRHHLGRQGGHPFYKWLMDNGYPKGYQTLCMNCQFIKRVENREYASSTRELIEQAEDNLRLAKQLIMEL